MLHHAACISYGDVVPCCVKSCREQYDARHDKGACMGICSPWGAFCLRGVLFADGVRLTALVVPFARAACLRALTCSRRWPAQCRAPPFQTPVLLFKILSQDVRPAILDAGG